MRTFVLLVFFSFNIFFLYRPRFLHFLYSQLPFSFEVINSSQHAPRYKKSSGDQVLQSWHPKGDKGAAQTLCGLAVHCVFNHAWPPDSRTDLNTLDTYHLSWIFLMYQYAS